MKYLTTAFSPMMLERYGEAYVAEIDIVELKENAVSCQSVIGHENTAKIVSLLLGFNVGFNRDNIELKSGDFVYIIIPKFRANEAREFTEEEVVNSGFRCFKVKVH
ncbi:MAG: STIV orfB116 family protein [Atribacterota bacterium]